MDTYETLRDGSQAMEVHRDQNATECGTTRRAERPADASRRNGQSLLADLYRPIQSPMIALERRLNREMQSPYEDVAPLLRHGVNLGGKRLRPAIHLLMADALGGATDANVTIGVVLEMVHTATLIHDDVLDDATERRHVPTVNAKWNSHTSILLGDYLFSQSFRLAASLDNTRTCSWVGEAARRVCEGELRQVLLRDELFLDEPTYIDLIRGKTAELCRVACSLAAGEAGTDSQVSESLSTYGDQLGVAFQIADDYLDLWGDDRSVGKTLGTDLQQGKMTLPVIRLLQTCSDPDRRRLVAVLRGDPDRRAAEVSAMLRHSDAKQYTMNTAIAYKDHAVKSLAVLPDSPAKRSLESIAQFSIRRSF
ncbi:MAG: polyprenyl synthetase family protein [Planctomycetota bacterium]